MTRGFFENSEIRKRNYSLQLMQSDVLLDDFKSLQTETEVFFV